MITDHMNIDKPTSKEWRVWSPDKKICIGNIRLHAEGGAYTPEERGIWCSYLYIAEQRTPKDLFAKVWLEPQLVRFANVSPERVDYKYNECGALNDLPFHGGITYYKPLCTVPNHRIIEVGCDWNHLRDQENGFASIDEVHDNLLEVYNRWQELVTDHENPPSRG